MNAKTFNPGIGAQPSGTSRTGRDSRPWMSVLVPVGPQRTLALAAGSTVGRGRRAVTEVTQGNRVAATSGPQVWNDSWNDAPIIPGQRVPQPPESFPYGSPDLRRPRAGRYRVFYTIDEEWRVVPRLVPTNAATHTAPTVPGWWAIRRVEHP